MIAADALQVVQYDQVSQNPSICSDCWRERASHRYRQGRL